MSDIPDNLRYAESHEWARDEGDGTFSVGISDHAQSQLGDVVYVEVPEVGRQVSAREEIAVVESVKAASDIYAPFAGEVVAVNEALADTPELVNSNPYDDGWMFRIRADDVAAVSALLDAAGYAAVVAREDG